MSLLKKEEVLDDTGNIGNNDLLSQSIESKSPTSTQSINTHVEKTFNNIIKSPNDSRTYRGLVLSNKMKIMLVSDPTTDKSAASMDVHVGYFNDPDDLCGLAHFCEHMLFLGTKKYPLENDYNSFLSQNGGSHNAETHMDYTIYYFDVDPEKLRDALERFSQFFVSPLFTETHTELELKAIDSEHSQHVANDAWRLHRVNKSSADPKHPLSKFGTGNRHTLETIPNKAGINVREALLKFYNKYYSSSIMSLSIVGKESLDELEQMVVEFFSEVKDNGMQIQTWPKHPFNEEHYQHKWYIVPIKDIKQLNIEFCIPEMQEHYKSVPSHYVSHLIGHQGEGSLLSALKAKGWCNSLTAILSSEVKGFNFFKVAMGLTEEGVEHIDDIILMIYQYINMLKKEGPVKWFFNEQSNIGKMNFRFKEKNSPLYLADTLSRTIQKYPIEEALTIGYLFSDWRPELIDELMEYLTPQNARVHIIAKKFESIANETESWYGTKFKKEKIPQDIIEKWSNAGYNDDLKFPPKNEFIPEKYDLKPLEKTVTKFPEIVEDTPLIRLWFKQDDQFLVPRATLTFQFVSPIVSLDPASYNMNCLFVHLFRDAIDEYTYAANLAGLEWRIRNHESGLYLGIGGYDDKQRILLEKIIDKLMNFKIDPERFEILKTTYIRNVKNFSAEQPYKHAAYYLVVLLWDQMWSKDELLAATSQLTYERTQEYIFQFLTKVHIECLIHGNVTMAEAIETAKLVESKLVKSIPHYVPLLPQHLLLNRKVRLEDGCNFLYETTNQTHKSSCTNVYYQAGLQSTESNMLTKLLKQIISEPCFTTLRTKEQLGYIVASGVHALDGILGLIITVQSSKHPQYIEQRIASFLDLMLEHITDMSEENFNKHKESVAVRHLVKPKTLANLTCIFWDEISGQQYNFDRANIEVAYLRTITQQQLLEYFKEIICSENRRKLSVHVISTVQGEPGSEDDSKEDKASQEDDSEFMKGVTKIEDITAFKMSQSLYPILKPHNDIPRKRIHWSKL